jgi:hypothetical protein
MLLNEKTPPAENHKPDFDKPLLQHDQAAFHPGL